MNRDKILEIKRLVGRAEIYDDWAVYAYIEEILKSLASEEDKEITKLMIEEFINGHPKMHEVQRRGLLNCISWLDTLEE